MRKILLLCFLLAMVSGCAHDAKLKPLLNSVVNIDQAKEILGPPSHIADMHNGSNLYVWSNSQNISVGGIPVYQPNNQTHIGTIHSSTGQGIGSYSGHSRGGSTTYTPVQNVNIYCEIKMEISQTGQILNWSYNGNNCDNLIVNEHFSSYAPSSNSFEILQGCLKLQAREMAETIDDFDELSNAISNKCFELTGMENEELSKYYSRMAQNNFLY